MKDKLDDSYQEIIDAASHILYSEEVQKSVEEETHHFQRTVQQHSPGTHIVDTELKNIIQQANDELIPALVKIQPRLKPILPPYGLDLIRSWIGTYLRHAACGTTSRKTLDRQYARAFVRDAVNEYMEFREITPILRFSADREFYLSRKVVEDKIRFRFVKHDFRRHARALGFHFFPDPSDLKDDLVSHQPYEWVLLVSKPIPRKKKFLGDEALKFGRWTHQMLTALSLWARQKITYSIFS
ncbi:MAG: hypothetical protein LWX52_12120 [Deltaproteobacteria bacterium]|jgi:hypothetical protein|nr:hypothetical protein [Deltaproteobacteria bacterium]